MSHWATNYIGLPYATGGRDRSGLDCWGALRLIYREQKGVDLPELPGVSAESVLSIAREILHQVKESWVEVETPQEMDAVARGQGSLVHHVGIWTCADGGKVVHCWRCPIIAETIRRLRVIRGLKLIKFYRYHGLHH